MDKREKPQPMARKPVNMDPRGNESIAWCTEDELRTLKNGGPLTKVRRESLRDFADRHRAPAIGENAEAREAKAALRAIIARSGRTGHDIDDLLNEIERAVKRFVRADSNKDIRAKAEDLADAAKEYRRVARAYVSATKSAEAAWPYLRMKASSPDKPPIAFKDAMCHVRAVADGLEGVGIIETAAKATVKRLTGGRLGQDDRRGALGWALFDLYKLITGAHPKAATGPTAKFDRPGTQFGNFVRLALLASPHFTEPRVQALVRLFRSFIKDSVKYGNRFSRLIPKGVQRTPA
jgi:hypothetical protein